MPQNFEKRRHPAKILPMFAPYLDSFKSVMRSSIYTENRTWESTPPWRTPLKIENQLPRTLFHLTAHCRWPYQYLRSNTRHTGTFLSNNDVSNYIVNDRETAVVLFQILIKNLIVKIMKIFAGFFPGYRILLRRMYRKVEISHRSMAISRKLQNIACMCCRKSTIWPCMHWPWPWWFGGYSNSYFINQCKYFG